MFLKSPKGWCRQAPWLALLVVAAGSSIDRALPEEAAKQAPKAGRAKTAKDTHDPLVFWFDPRRAQPAAAAEMVLAQDPLVILALRLRGKSLVVWGEPEFAADEAPALDPQWLSDARSRDGKAPPDIRRKAPDEITKPEKAYYLLYNQALVNSFWTPASAFAKSARENDYVKFPHMYNETWKYRGKVIHVEGNLKRLNKLDANSAAQARGVRYQYEGWIALPTLGTHPICVIFPILPEGLKPAEQMNQWVTFDGYLISLYRYKSGKGVDLNTPLLIGPTLHLGEAPPPQRVELITPTLVYGFIGFVCTVIVLVGVLGWWYRRGDRRVRSRLAELQAERTMAMFDQPPPEGTDES